MNYTIFTREQVIPKYLPSGALNMGPVPIYPEGASVLYTPPTFDRWSDYPADRKVLLIDPLCPAENAATMTEADEAFPLFRDWNALYIREEGDIKLKGLIGHYLEGEQGTWPQQRDEAIRWSGDGFQGTPYCDRIALSRGISREAQLGYVLEKVNAFESSADTLGTQQAILDRIYAATTIDGVMSEQWPA